MRASSEASALRDKRARGSRSHGAFRLVTKTMGRPIGAIPRARVNPMGLVGSLWNRDIQTRLRHVYKHIPPDPASQAEFRPVPPATDTRSRDRIVDSITAVLAGKPEMRVTDARYGDLGWGVGATR
jgi:hypothetical protein